MLLGKLDHQLLCVTPEFGGKISLYEEEPDLRAYHQSLLNGDMFLIFEGMKNSSLPLLCLHPGS